MDAKQNGIDYSKRVACNDTERTTEIILLHLNIITFEVWVAYISI